MPQLPAPTAGDGPVAMPGARATVGTPVAAGVGAVVAVALGALGVVAIRDGVRAAGLVHGSAWLPSTVDRLAAVHRTAHLLPLVAVAAVVVGVLLCAAAVRPRPHDAFALRGTTTTTLRTRDLVRIVHTAVDGQPGLDDVGVSASRRTIRVRVSTRDTDAGGAGGAGRDIEESVRGLVGPRLAALDPTPALRVSVQRTRDELPPGEIPASPTSPR